MEPEIHKGWTIIIRESKSGFAALLVDTKGRKFEGAVICTPSAKSAERYAHKAINWSVKLQEQREIAENSLRNITPEGLTFLTCTQP